MNAMSKATFPQFTSGEVLAGLGACISCLILLHRLFGIDFALILSCAFTALLQLCHIENGTAERQHPLCRGDRGCLAGNTENGDAGVALSFRSPRGRQQPQEGSQTQTHGWGKTLQVCPSQTRSRSAVAKASSLPAYPIA